MHINLAPPTEFYIGLAQFTWLRGRTLSKLQKSIFSSPILAASCGSPIDRFPKSGGNYPKIQHFGTSYDAYFIILLIRLNFINKVCVLYEFSVIHWFCIFSVKKIASNRVHR